MAAKKQQKQVWPGILPPKETCEDENCPFHGTISLRGRSFVGQVVSIKAQKTATITWERRVYVKKYERYLKQKTRIRVHNPDCMEVKLNDFVRVVETRPLSKTKHHVIVGVVQAPLVDETKTPAKKSTKKEE